MMSIQVLNNNDDLTRLCILLDVCDCSTMPEAKKIINACNRAIKKKNCSEEVKREILEFRDNLIRKVEELEKKNETK